MGGEALGEAKPSPFLTENAGLSLSMGAAPARREHCVEKERAGGTRLLYLARVHVAEAIDSRLQACRQRPVQAAALSPRVPDRESGNPRRLAEDANELFYPDIPDDLFWDGPGGRDAVRRRPADGGSIDPPSEPRAEGTCGMYGEATPGACRNAWRQRLPIATRLYISSGSSTRWSVPPLRRCA